MEIAQGDIWWVEFGDPVGSEPGWRRPAVVVQSQLLNASMIATILCVPLTTNLRMRHAPGHVLLPAATLGLPRDSLANATGLTALARERFSERAGRITPGQLLAIMAGIDIALGR